MHRFTVIVNDVKGEVNIEENVILFHTLLDDHADKEKKLEISVYDVIELLRSRRDQRSAKMIYVKKNQIENEEKMIKNEEVNSNSEQTYNNDKIKSHDVVSGKHDSTTQENRKEEYEEEEDVFVKESVVLKFVSLAEREKFICSIVDAKNTQLPSSSNVNSTAINEAKQSSEIGVKDEQRGNKTMHRMPESLTTDQWRTRAICAAAIDSGIVDDEEELERIISNVEKEQNQNQRGVVQVFDALESLVDSETLELRPITEQVENDILRQIPALAVIYSKRVLDADARRSFWEAVVQKYFCFSRTFLEDDFRLLESNSNYSLNERDAGSNQRLTDNVNIDNNQNASFNVNNNSIITNNSALSESGRIESSTVQLSTQSRKTNVDELELINATSLQALPKLLSTVHDGNESNKSEKTNTHRNKSSIGHAITGDINNINNINNSINDNNESDDELHLLELIENDEINDNTDSSMTKSIYSNFFSPNIQHHARLDRNQYFVHTLSQCYNNTYNNSVKYINNSQQLMESSYTNAESVDSSSIDTMPIYYTAHLVEHILPQEPSDRSMLELLRQFWRCQPTQRATMAASFIAQSDARNKANDAKAHVVTHGFLLSNCYKRAREVAENLLAEKFDVKALESLEKQHESHALHTKTNKPFILNKK